MNTPANHNQGDTNSAAFPRTPKAHQKADGKSKTRLPQRYIPSDFEVIAEVEALGLLVVVNGNSAKGWAGRRQKTDFYYRFPNEDRRNEYIIKYIERIEEQAAAQAARRATRSNPHGLKVGSVLQASWGYDQTNIDYYEVVALHGKTMVSVREIAQDRDFDGAMSGQCVPKPGEYTSEAKRYRVNADSNSIKVHGHTSAYLIEPKQVGDLLIWPVSYWSAYA